MRFLKPENFFLFWFLPFLISAWMLGILYKLRGRRKFGNVTKLREISKISPLWRDIFRSILLSLVLATLILTLAHPQYKGKERTPKLRNIDMVFLLDTSPSMRAQDVEPCRLLKAKEVIASFIIGKKTEDRIGLVTFSETSLILSYLTSDLENILFYLDWLSAETKPILGTNIGRGIKTGIRVFQKDDEIQEVGAYREASISGQEKVLRGNRIFILISDGEDHGEELDEAIREAKHWGIPIYSIGIGSKQEVPIPISWEGGKLKYLVVNDKIVTTRFNDSTLHRITEQTEGKIYRSFTGQDLPLALHDILMTERQVQGYKLDIEYKDAYPQFLSLACVMFLVAMII